MLFGAHKQDTEDRDMTVTVAFNHFGPGLGQRLPRYFKKKRDSFKNYTSCRVILQYAIYSK